jgi:hypothetical protein
MSLYEGNNIESQLKFDCLSSAIFAQESLSGNPFSCFYSLYCISPDLREIGWGGMDWIDLAQDREKWRALMNRVMKLRVP